jgi:hypothetical protein
MPSGDIRRPGGPAPSATASSAEDAVDVVVAWVDGADPEHRAKRKRYLADPGGDAELERAAHDERRFSDNDEIRFCLRSIRNYAPWVRTIWLVTDNSTKCPMRCAIFRTRPGRPRRLRTRFSKSRLVGRTLHASDQPRVLSG